MTRQGDALMGLAVDRISVHEVRLLLVFQRQPENWLTNAEVAEAARISPRTARLHTSRLVELGILEVQRLYPASRFQPKKEPGEAGRDYLERWQKAREVYEA